MKQLGLEIADAPKQERAAPIKPKVSFHVRSSMTVDEVLGGEESAEGQEDVLLKFFLLYSREGERWTPSEIHARPQFQRWPVTSVRRALTDLTKAGQLVHHQSDRRPGPYGANESTWSLSVPDLGSLQETKGVQQP